MVSSFFTFRLHPIRFKAEWEGNILLNASQEKSSRLRCSKIRPVCLTISSRDKIKRPEKISDRDLRKTAMIIGSYILADRKMKFQNRRELANLIIIAFVIISVTEPIG